MTSETMLPTKISSIESENSFCYAKLGMKEIGIKPTFKKLNRSKKIDYHQSGINKKLLVNLKKS